MHIKFRSKKHSIYIKFHREILVIPTVVALLSTREYKIKLANIQTVASCVRGAAPLVALQ